MTDHPLTCDEVRDLAPELALGALEGSQRGAALAHLDRCPACRAHVDDLATTVDRLVSIAPEAEPPAGFESAVLARIAEEQQVREIGAWRRRSVAPLAVAAAVFLVLGIGVGIAVSRDVGTTIGGTEVASAAMITPDGDTVGEVWHSAGSKSAVFVSVPEWSDTGNGEAAAGPFTLRVELKNGTTVTADEFELEAGTSSWAESTDVDGDDIAAVSVLDADGDVWCTGTFA